MGISGAPSRISGGATIISDHVLQHVRGEHEAVENVHGRGERDPEREKPRRKVTARQGGRNGEPARRSSHHPRR